MINYDNNFETMEIECDKCSHSEEIEGYYNNCIANLKKKGWKMFYTDGEWQHFCSDCKPKSPYPEDHQIKGL